MPVICCAWCGTPFPGRGRSKYCNLDCYRKARKENISNPKHVEVCLNACQYNEGVYCFPIGGCSKCGWNPEVARKRSERIEAELLGAEEVLSGGD